MDINAYIESGIIESYVLGLATAEEIAEVELLCSQHPEIKKAVDNFSASIEKHMLQNAEPPSAYVKENLMQKLSAEFKAEENASSAFSVPTIETAKVSALWQRLAAAAIILLVVSAALNFYFYNNYSSVKNNYEALLNERNSLQVNNDAYKTKLNLLDSSLQLLTSPDMQVVKMTAVPGKEGSLATVYWSTKTKDVYLLQNNLPQAPTDKQYQLWAIVDGKPVDAGVIGDCSGGLCKLKNIPKASAFAITLEKKGGSQTPTTTAMYVMGAI